MLVRTSMESESQDATKITYALEDSRIYSSVKMMTVDMHMNARTILLIISLSFSSSVLAMSTRRLTGVCRINQWTKYYGSLAFSRQSVDLEFNEEVMKPERFTEAPDHTDLKPDTMKGSKWYQEAISRTSDAFVETSWESV